MVGKTIKTGCGYNLKDTGSEKWISSKKPTGYGRKNGLYKSGTPRPV